MTTHALSRRALIATSLAAGTTAAFAPALAQERMTAEKMRSLIDYTIRKNNEEGKNPTIFSKVVTPVLFDRSEEVRIFQIGNDEGALRERLGVTLNLSQQQVIVFSRTESAIYFHLTDMRLLRARSAVNRREGASLWTAPEAATDFARQMSYWAVKSLTT